MVQESKNEGVVFGAGESQSLNLSHQAPPFTWHSQLAPPQGTLSQGRCSVLEWVLCHLYSRSATSVGGENVHFNHVLDIFKYN